MKHLPKFSPGLALIAPVAAVTAVQTAHAASYIKLGDIKGEATDQAHSEWTEIDSFEWAIECDPPAGDRQHEPVTITKRIDKSSPLLMLSCATGNSDGAIPEVFLAVTDPERNGGEDFLKITFSDVIVTSFQSTGTDDAESSSTATREQISFTYQKITWSYAPRDGSDPVEVSHEFSDPATSGP